MASPPRAADWVKLDLLERREDIPLLFAWFIGRAAQRHGRLVPRWSQADMDLDGARLARERPELRNAAERFTLGIGEPAEPAADASLSDRVDRFERALVEQALARAGGNVTSAAEALGVPKKTLYDKLRRHGVEPERFREG